MKLNLLQRMFVFFTEGLIYKVKKIVNYKEIQSIRMRNSVSECGKILTVNGSFKGFGKHVFLGEYVNFNDNVFINGSGKVSIGNYFHTGVTFHHVDNPYLSFKEVFRILKPNGIFYVLNERTLSVLKPELKQVVALELEFAHEHTFFASEWKNFLKEAGFKVTSIRPKYFSYDRILDRVYGKSKPKTSLGKLKYFYYKFFSFLNINNNHFLFKPIQRVEDHYLGNVPFSALAKK